jgi:hypothetical protein
MIGEALPDESHPDLHLNFNWRSVPMRVFLGPEDLERLPPTAREYLPQAALSGHAVLRVLTAEGAFALPGEVSIDHLRIGTRSPATARFLQHVSDVFYGVHDRLRSIFSDALKLGKHPAAALQLHGFDYLKNCDARWLDEGAWRMLVRTDGMYFAGFTHPIDPPNVATWISLATLLDDQEGIAAWHSLLESSAEHLSAGDLRLAVIDAITALEALAKRLFRKALAKTTRAAGLPEDWAFEMTNGQLQSVSKRCLPILESEGLLSKEQQGTLIRGIRARNSLIHEGPQQLIHREEVVKLVSAVDSLVASLEKFTCRERMGVRRLHRPGSAPLYSRSPMRLYSHDSTIEPKVPASGETPPQTTPPKPNPAG